MKELINKLDSLSIYEHKEKSYSISQGQDEYLSAGSKLDYNAIIKISKS